MLKFVSPLVLAVLVGWWFVWEQPPSDVPIDIEIPFHPIPVKAEGQLHLLYELHLTNFHSQTQILTRVDVKAESVKLAQYTGDALFNLIAHPGAAPGAKLNAAVPGGTRAVVFLDVTLDARAVVPAVAWHRMGRAERTLQQFKPPSYPRRCERQASSRTAIRDGLEPYRS